jgi:hypothetical protein
LAAVVVAAMFASLLVLASSAMAASGFWTVRFEEPANGAIQVDSRVPVMKDIAINVLGLYPVIDYHYLEYIPDTELEGGQLPQQQLTGTCPGTTNPNADLCVHDLNKPLDDTSIDIPIKSP